MADPIRARRLPWETDGKPSYTVSEPDGMLTRLADAKEAELINTAGIVLGHALTELDRPGADFRFVTEQLVGALAGALLVADLRGERCG